MTKKQQCSANCHLLLLRKEFSRENMVALFFKIDGATMRNASISNEHCWNIIERGV